MIAIIGANGKTGREVVRLALQQDLEIIPIVRDDKDADHLDSWVSVNQLRCADADHPEALRSALSDVDGVISCIDSRTSGFGAPTYNRYAAGNVVNVAAHLGIKKILHLSVMGAYRWSPNPLNRASFHHDRWIRKSDAPWTMLRVSCYHDEIINSHVRPPDKGRPHPVHPSSRYSPVSRKDAARAALKLIPQLIPNRTVLCGGPQTYNGRELEELVATYRQNSRSKTNFGPLPHGDFSVSTETTTIMLGWQPQDSLLSSLDLQSVIKRESEPFWNRQPSDFHKMDQKQDVATLHLLNTGLRYALHESLHRDALEMGLQEPQSIDFSMATIDGDGTTIHGSQIHHMEGVFILNTSDERHGPYAIQHIYDDLADDLHVWFSSTEGIPERIWNKLDLGIRRRLSTHPTHGKDIKVREFAAKRHERLNFV